MPEEPNQKMDALLKAYAEKRRGEAGAPFDLHPATRNLLQGEVARTFGKPDLEAKPKLAFGLLWKFALGAAAVVVLAISISQPHKEAIEVAAAGGSKSYLSAPVPATAVAEKPVAFKKTDRSIMDNGSINAPEPQSTIAPESLTGKTPEANFATTATGSWKMNGAAENDNRTAGKAATEKYFALKDSSDAPATPPAQQFDKIARQTAFDESSSVAFGAKVDGDLGVRTTNAIAVTNSLNLAAVDQTKHELFASGHAAAKATDEESSKLIAGRPPGSPAPANEFPAKELFRDLAKTRTDQTLAAAPTATTPALAQTKTPSAHAATAIGGNLATFNRAGGQQNFQQLSRRSQLRENVQSPPLPELLNNFRVEREGDTVQVIDEDGSVYSGEIVRSRDEAAKVASVKGAELDSKKAEAKVKRSKQLASQPQLEAEAISVSGKDMAQSGETFSFRVSGLNRRLNKNVVFTGQYLSQSTAEDFFANKLQSRSEPAQKQTASVSGIEQPLISGGQQQISPANRITGKVQIGRATEIEIEALQNGP